MGMGFNVLKSYEEIKGKKGNIYIARKGTVIIVDLDNGDNYTYNTSCNTCVKNAVRSFWDNSIEWSGSFSDFKTFGMIPSDKKPLKEPLCPLTPEQIEKLQG